MPARPRAPVHLPRLTALRWYAVLIIFAYNLNAIVSWRPLHIFSFGSTGGSFFFLLSGFVLTYSMPRRLNKREFYVARFARIYPSALVVIIGAAALAVVWAQAPVITGARELLASILLLHAWLPAAYSHSYDGATWALSVLVFCYATFPFVVTVLRSLRRQARAVAAVTLLGASGLAGLVLARQGHADLAYTLPILRFAEFFAGTVIGLRVRRGWRVNLPVSLAVVVVIGAAVVARRVTQQPMPDYVMMLPYALLIVAAANADLRGARGPLQWRLPVSLGRLAFTFYLVQQLVSAFLARLLDWDHSWGLGSGIVPSAVMLAASIAAAFVLHLVIEVPCSAWLRVPRFGRILSLTQSGGRHRVFEMSMEDGDVRLELAREETSRDVIESDIPKATTDASAAHFSQRSSDGVA